MAPKNTSDSAASNGTSTKSAPAPATIVTSLDTTKRSFFMMDPATVQIVGIDFGGPGDPGYDERVKLPLDEQMVESITSMGVVRTVIARKDGERIVAVDGRRRVMHARAANLKLQALNPLITAGDLIKVPVEVVRGDELALLERSRVANGYAVKDSPLMNARVAQQLLDKGRDMRRISVVFGVSEQTIGDWLKLLDLAPEAAALVESGEMSHNAAVDLTGISMAEQVAVLRKVRDEALPKGKDGKPKINAAAVREAVRDTRAANGTGANLKKTPSDRVKATCVIFEALIKEALKLDDVGNPLPSDVMFSALRRIHLAITDKKWDAAVKAAVKAAAPAEDDAG